MNPNTPLPTAEELAKLRIILTLDAGIACSPWDQLPITLQRSHTKVMQAILDHLKPWLKGGPQIPAVVRQMAKDIGWGKEPQPPDWLKNPLKAKECAECPTFLNAVARIKELESEAANHSGELASAKMTAMYAERHQAELQAKLETAEKRLAELEESSPWVPISERLPTKEDADETEEVAVTDGKAIWLFRVNLSPSANMTHWMPFVPPKQPTPEDHRREVFEKAFAGFYDFLKDSLGEYVSPETRQAWTVWQRAIVETENKAQP